MKGSHMIRSLTLLPYGYPAGAGVVLALAGLFANTGCIADRLSESADAPAASLDADAVIHVRGASCPF